MTHANVEQELPPAAEAIIRANAARLREVASRHGIRDLRFASSGRLVGHVASNRDLFDVFAFQHEARQLLGADVELFSDAILDHEHVSPDLASASAL